MVEYLQPQKKKVQLDAFNNPIITQGDVIF